jgi:hypothetical protein
MKMLRTPLFAPSAVISLPKNIRLKKTKTILSNNPDLTVS